MVKSLPCKFIVQWRFYHAFLLHGTMFTMLICCAVYNLPCKLFASFTLYHANSRSFITFYSSQMTTTITDTELCSLRMKQEIHNLASTLKSDNHIKVGSYCFCFRVQSSRAYSHEVGGEQARLASAVLISSSPYHRWQETHVSSSSCLS